MKTRIFSDPNRLLSLTTKFRIKEILNNLMNLMGMGNFVFAFSFSFFVFFFRHGSYIRLHPLHLFRSETLLIPSIRLELDTPIKFHKPLILFHGHFSA